MTLTISRVLTTSAVFRNLLASPLPLHLDEDAVSLRPFLAVIAGEDIFAHLHNNDDSSVFDWQPSVLGAMGTLHLLAKYDTRELRYALTSLKCLVMEGTVCPLETFILAASVDNIDLARVAVTGDIEAAVVTLHAEHPERVARVRSCWESVPESYKAALGEVIHLGDARKRGNRFYELMCLDGRNLLGPTDSRSPLMNGRRMIPKKIPLLRSRPSLYTCFSIIHVLSVYQQRSVDVPSIHARLTLLLSRELCDKVLTD